MSSWQAYKQTMIAPPSLGAAAKANDVALLQALLAAEDAEIDARDSRGYSPLMLAAYSGSMEAFELLLARGADPNGTDLAGNSILMGAAFKGHAAMVELLLQRGADPTARNASGLTAHAFAVQFGRVEIVPLLERALSAAQH